MNELTYPAGWAELAPCGCVSGCSEPPLASASPCSVPLPACEQRGVSSGSRMGNCCAEPASTEPSPAAASCLCRGRCPQGQGQAGTPQAVATQRRPLGKGTAARAAAWFEQLVSPTGTSVSQLSPDANQAGNLFPITAALHRKRVEVAAPVAAALEMPSLICKDGSLLMKPELGSIGAGRTKKKKNKTLCEKKNLMEPGGGAFEGPG